MPYRIVYICVMKSIKKINTLLVIILSVLVAGCTANNTEKEEVNGTNNALSQEKLREYVTFFNEMEEEDVVNYVDNEASYEWLKSNIPLLDVPDSILEQTYYFRWWTFRKHLKDTPDGFVFTEFITDVKHGGKHNTISCALGHHIYEGRWLHNPEYIDDYISFWLVKDENEPAPKVHKFSGWTADAVYNRYLVNNDEVFAISMLDELEEDYEAWVKERGLENGLFWQYDVRDGMEESISGSRTEENARPTINSYMYANAKAIAKIATMVNNDSLAITYNQKADKIKELVQTYLWDSSANFFKVMFEDGTLSGAREEIGFIPWYFGLPDDTQEYGSAWEQLKDSTGFASPWGLTTAERRHPEFRTHGSGHGCEWDGAVWPFATTQTLKGLATLIDNYENHSMDKKDYFQALKTYAEAHQKNGKPYIGEYQDEKTGKWLKGDNPRSRYYNHSSFADLIINDLIGLKPRPDNVVEVRPLIPEDQWDWFCLDNVSYHDRILTIRWDRTGEKYGQGKGFRIYADGEEIFHSNELKNIEAELPENADFSKEVADL